MDTLLTLMYWYIGLSFAGMLYIALYFAYTDIRAYFHINGHVPDNKFGYAYGSAIVLTIFFILAALPFVNIVSAWIWIDLSIRNKKERAKREAQKANQ